MHGFVPVKIFLVDHRRCLGQQRFQIRRRASRYEHRQDHARQRGMQSGLVKEEPEQDPADRIRKCAIHAGAVEHDEQDHDRRSRD